MRNLLLLILAILPSQLLYAKDVELAQARADELAQANSEQIDAYSPARAPAPLQVQKGEQTLSSLSPSQKKELSSEFGGILYMALKKYPYEQWPGKEMSDCSAGGGKGACYQCEMITGHANAYYFFYRDNTQKACTLQNVEVAFDVSDATVLKDLKKTAHSLFGSEVYEQQPEAQAAALGVETPAYRWTTNSDLAYLYMDHKEGTPQARFQWRRYPLYN